MSTAVDAGHGTPTPSEPTVKGSGSASDPGQCVDWGRIVMVPFCVVLGAGAVVRAWTIGLDGESDLIAHRVLAAVAALLTVVFYAFFTKAYLGRRPAHSTTRAPLALLAAPLATFMPLVIPFFGDQQAGDRPLLLGDFLLAAGFFFSAWSMRVLGRNLSLVPQARQLVMSGPYGRVRHPLYLGELVAVLGLALTLGGVAPLVFWCALVLLQAFRAVQEEAHLSSSLSGYAEYAARTSRILPGLF